MPDHKISLDVQSLLDVFSRTVFKNPEEDVLRELLTNAQDACILRKVQDPAFVEPLITISVDEQGLILRITDNGIGMSEEDLQKYFATLGSSSSFKRQASRTLPGQVEGLLGSYGMGTIAYLIVADEMDVVTRSLRPGAQGVRWIFRGGDRFQIERSAEEIQIGTTVSLRLKRKYAGLASKERVLSILEHLVPYLEVPVTFEGERIEGTGRYSRREMSEVTPLTAPYARLLQRDAQPEDGRIGVLRFDVSGNWSARDFAAWLSDLESAYIRLSAFLFASSHDAEIMEAAARPYVGTVVSLQNRNEFQAVIRLTESRVYDLRIRRVQIASPGFIELIGSLNPIKTLADFITNWRSENTKRQEMVLVHKRSLADRAAEIVKASPTTEFADRFLRFALEEPSAKLTLVSRDIRIEQVSWHPLDGASTDEKLPLTTTEK